MPEVLSFLQSGIACLPELWFNELYANQAGGNRECRVKIRLPEVIY